MMLLSGTTRDEHDRDGATDGRPTASAGALIKSTNTDNKFNLSLYHSNAKVYDFGMVNFDRSSPRWIRNILNTSPKLTNSTVTDQSNFSKGEHRYWLGETYERSVAENTDSSTRQWGVILPLMSASTAGQQDRQGSWANAQTGWFFSQDFGASSSFNPPNSCTKLFKFHALDYGAWPNRNIKIAIEDLRAGTTPTSPYGSFTVAVYPASAYDTDAGVGALEKFTNCNLDPESGNYVLAKIGDRTLSWSDANRIHTEIGEYENKSQYIRIEMNPNIGTNPSILPFGVTGPLRSVGFSYLINSASAQGGVYSTVISSGSYTLGAFGAPTAPTIPTIAQTGRAFVSGTDTSSPARFKADLVTSSFAIFTGVTQFLSGGFTGSWRFRRIVYEI
jgi:hypothetical protein